MVSWFSKLVVATTVRMPKWFVRWVSRRYVAGASLDEAVAVMKRLTVEGACFTIDVLGEEISNMDEANFFLEEYIRVMQLSSSMIWMRTSASSQPLLASSLTQIWASKTSESWFRWLQRKICLFV